jgi:hypothetical protein
MNNVMPCSLLLKENLRGYHTLQGDNSLKSVERFDHTTSGQPIWRGCTLRGEVGSYIYTSGFLRSLDELKNENYKNGMVE